MKLEILFLAVIAAVKSVPLKTNTDNCIANYLKKIEFLSNDFGDESELSSSCELLVESIKINFYRSLKNSLIQDEEMKNHSECIIENVQETEYGDKLLVLHVLEKDNITITKIENEEKKSAIMLDIYALITKATLKCKVNELFGEIFDSIFDEEENSSEEEFSDVEDYCLRKYVIEHNLLDKSKYQLNGNPKNIDTTALNCVTIYNSVVEKIEQELVKMLTSEMNSSEEEVVKNEENKMELDCLLTIIHAGKYVELLTPFDYLKEFKFADEEKAEEKQKFINILSDLTEQFASKCSKLT